MKNIPLPVKGTYPPYFDNYFKLLPQDDANIFELLTKTNMDSIDLFTSVDGETLEFRYAEGKWNMLEILQHLLDTERIFTYRALRIARGDKAENPGFDENAFVDSSGASQRNVMDMIREFSLLRAGTIELFKSLPEHALTIVGRANGFDVTPATIAYAIVAHEAHHLKIIEERYLPK